MPTPDLSFADRERSLDAGGDTIDIDDALAHQAVDADDRDADQIDDAIDTDEDFDSNTDEEEDGDEDIDTDEDFDSDTDEDDDSDAGEDDVVTFGSLGLPQDVLDAITAMGFVTPTPIQAESIPALLEKRDVVGIAQTGTGKTAAFGLPLISLVDAKEKSVQALVLAPTRELAMQSAQAIDNFAAKTRGLDVVAVYGGSAYGPQIGALKRGAQVVVGTPGRIIDLIEKGALDLSGVRMLVLDEADEMLRMGFAEDVETIAESVPTDRLTALFSATMPAAIERVAATHLTNPLRIAVSEESSTVDTIYQTYAVVPYKHKIGALARVLATRAQHVTQDSDAAIVFVRTRLDVEEISLELAGRGFRAAGISGDVAQTERERMVDRLKKGALDVLVATDVAARGLDVERIGLVINFDVPREPEAYVHRIGRTGRAGRAGRSLTFFTPREHSRLRRIEKLTGTPMEEVAIPSPAAVSEFRARRTLDALNQRIERGRLDLYYTLLDEMHDTTELDVSDIAAALLAQAVGDEGPERRIEKDRRGDGKIRREEELDESGEFLGASFEVGRDKDRPLKGGKDGARRRGGGRHFAGQGRRYRVEVGKKDRVKPGAIVGAITGEGGLAGSDIGNIEIFPTFSLVEISGDISPTAMGKIAKARVSGRALRIREDEGPGAGRAFGEGRGGRRSERDEYSTRSFDKKGRGDRRFGGSRGH
ncbi:DEAD/DEAH box helicase [Schaalia suimastitidis]|uniref:DEAD/DEAH box helicase n=1 Tax=Schaalia suimastitidis TaxID=121163 RepID=UPI001F0A539A|nr:DEAD/DEAH box helicase [Schaalia suimastitidis]